MEEKKNTVIKIINTVLCIGIVVSVCINVHQYKDGNTLKSQIATLESEIKTLETEQDTLSKEIESKKTEESDLSKQIENLNTTIEQLEADNKSLSDNLKALEDENQGDNADIDVDYVDSIDDVVDDILEEYYQSNPTQAPTTGYQGPPVGTPSTGELPTYNFGESGQDGIDKNATVY